MDATALALSLATMGIDLIAKGRELWQSTGRDPAEFDSATAAQIKARGVVIDEQRAAELAAMGGK